MKRIAVIQPGYLPWLGFFDLMIKSDVFVVYDDVQFDKNSWRNRNRIKTKNGVQWLTVPVLTKKQGSPTNKEIRVKDTNWRRKHLLTLEFSYSKAPFYKEVISIINKGLSMDSDRLIDISFFFIREFRDYMGIDTEIFMSSELGVGGSDKAERLINISKHLGGTHYYNGAMGKKLYSKDVFEESGLKLEFQDYDHPVYPQLHGDFTPYLSIVDLLFNVGPEARNIIISGSRIV